jgi:hypothetical protein
MELTLGAIELSLPDHWDALQVRLRALVRSAQA